MHSFNLIAMHTLGTLLAITPLGLSHVGRSRLASFISRLSRSHVARVLKLSPIARFGDSYGHAARVLPVNGLPTPY